MNQATGKIEKYDLDVRPGGREHEHGRVFSSYLAKIPWIVRVKLNLQPSFSIGYYLRWLKWKRIHLPMQEMQAGARFGFWWERSPGRGNGNPLQYSCLGNPMDREPGGLQSMGLQRIGPDLETGHK